MPTHSSLKFSDFEQVRFPLSLANPYTGNLVAALDWPGLIVAPSNPPDDTQFATLQQRVGEQSNHLVEIEREDGGYLTELYDAAGLGRTSIPSSIRYLVSLAVDDVSAIFLYGLKFRHTLPPAARNFPGGEP